MLLFTVDRTIVIDGGVGGRAARYVNHSCDPNCEADEIGGRIFITSIRDIPAGAELTYDYNVESAVAAAARLAPALRLSLRGARAVAAPCVVRPRRRRSTDGGEETRRSVDP